MDHPSTARSEERWDRTFMVSVDTDDGAAHGAFGAFLGPKTRDVPKKRTMCVVSDILDMVEIAKSFPKPRSYFGTKEVSDAYKNLAVYF